MHSFGYLYKITMLQELKPPDQDQRVAFCWWLLHFSRRIPKVLDQIYFLDEAWFHLLGYINAKNFHIWSLENPRKHWITSMHLQKIHVGCTMSWLNNQTYFFTAIVTAECDHKFILSFELQQNKLEQRLFSAR